MLCTLYFAIAEESLCRLAVDPAQPWLAAIRVPDFSVLMLPSVFLMQNGEQSKETYM